MNITTELKVNGTTFFTEGGTASKIMYCREALPLELPSNVSLVYAGLPSPEALASLAAKGIHISQERIHNVANQQPVTDPIVFLPNTYLVHVVTQYQIIVYRVAGWMEMLQRHPALVLEVDNATDLVAGMVDRPRRTIEFFSDLEGIEILQGASGDATFDLDVAARIAVTKMEVGESDEWEMCRVYAAYMYVRTYGVSRICN